MFSTENVCHLEVGDCFELMGGIPDGSVDLIIADGPFGITKKEWDFKHKDTIQDFNLKLIKESSRILRDSGTLYLFGKADCIDLIDYRPYLTLRRKIVWFIPNSLCQGKYTYTNNYDLICYFVKSERESDRDITFNLDSIRVPQLTPLEQRKRVEKVPSVQSGKWKSTKFNEKGKNVGDVWFDIKPLTYKSKELVTGSGLKTIQKPEKLIERLVLASSNEGDLVLDPFVGNGTTAVVCQKHKRRFLGFDESEKQIEISKSRIEQNIY